MKSNIKYLVYSICMIFIVCSCGNSNSADQAKKDLIIKEVQKLDSLSSEAQKAGADIDARAKEIEDALDELEK